MHPLTKPAHAPSNDFRAAVLRVVDRFCSDVSGYCTADLAAYVASQPGCESNHMHSAAVLRELRALEAIGHVRRLDDRLPIVWCKA